jgi:hypothetical protein
MKVGVAKAAQSASSTTATIDSISVTPLLLRRRDAREFICNPHVDGLQTI